MNAFTIKLRAILTAARNLYDQQHIYYTYRRNEADPNIEAVRYYFRYFKFFQKDREWELCCKFHLEDLLMDCGAVTWH